MSMLWPSRMTVRSLPSTAADRSGSRGGQGRVVTAANRSPSDEIRNGCGPCMCVMTVRSWRPARGPSALRYASCYEYREGSAVPYTDDREEFHGAMRRLRRLLLGDGVGSPGRLKGEDARAQATRDLRRMREAFDAVAARSEEVSTEKADVEARVADLQEELKRVAASTARRAGGVIPSPKQPTGGSAGTSKTRTVTSKTRPRSPKRKRKT